MVTLAPEVEGAALLQEQLVRRGIVTALGHSLADDACVRESVTRGARHVTHLFNAMGPLHHRTLGMAGSALTDDRLTADLICDGVHVHPAVVRLAARAKGDGLVLITDRVDPGPEGSGFGSGAVHDDGAALRLPDGTLAGSSSPSTGRSATPGTSASPRSRPWPPARCARRGCSAWRASAAPCAPGPAPTWWCSTPAGRCARRGSRAGACTRPRPPGPPARGC